MPRKLLIRSNIHPYHVTNRVNNREWFQLDLPLVWRIFANEWIKVSFDTGARAHSFVLMSNHYHMNISTPDEPIDEVMRHFHRSVTQTFNPISGRCGHLFNQRYVWNLIDDPRHYTIADKYVYRNPVRAGMVERVEDYPFSTLHGLVGASHLPFPLYYPGEGAGDELGARSFKDYLDFLNVPFATEEQDSIRRAFRRRIFRLGPEPSTGRKPLLYSTQS